MDLKLISDLIDRVNASRLRSFEIEEGNLRIRMENAFAEPAAAQPIFAAVPVSAPAAAPAATPEPAQPAAENDDSFVYVTAPLVGVFCPLENCGKTALAPGDRITKKQVVCAIEAMKLLNEVESDAEGEYVETLVQAGDQVEFGQPIIKLKK